MGLDNLRGKVSNRDIEKVRQKKNAPEYEPGFEPNSFGENDDGGFDSIFDDFDMDEFENNSRDNRGFGNSADNSGFNSIGFNPGGFNSGGFNSGGFGNMGMGFPGEQINDINNLGQNKKKEKKEDLFDQVINSTVEASKNTSIILLNAAKSIKNRNAEDMGVYGKNMIILSGAFLMLGFILGFIGLFAGIEGLKISNLPIKLIIVGILNTGTGFVFISTSALYILMRGENKIQENNQIIPSVTEDLEFEYDFEDFDEDGDEKEDITFDRYEHKLETEEKLEELDSLIGNMLNELDSKTKENIDYAERREDNINNLKNVAILNRKTLVNNFKPFFIKNTPNFHIKTEIPKDSEDFNLLETIALKALASASTNKNLEDIESYLDRATDNLFSIELKMERVKGVKNLDAIVTEMVAYFKDEDNDSISAEVSLEGDFYKIIINKGKTAVITMGDLFGIKEVEDYILDEQIMLPIIIGVDLYGRPIKLDAKLFDAIMIVGKPRSGKSWHLFNFLLSLMAFNTPEDVQFILIDPKDTHLFNCLSLMPHTCGLHNTDNLLQVMKDIIEIEGPRRKKLFKEMKCDNIWELRNNKKIKMPLLYLVIDEIMSVQANLGEIKWKEFQSLLAVIISQLPSLGIRVIIVPHRAQSIIDKTLRSLITYAAAICADNSVVKETLDINYTWGIPLINPGDTAVKAAGLKKEIFIKGTTFELDDTRLADLIKDLAKAFYKMGVYIPEMQGIGNGYNRKEEKIREELMNEGVYMVNYNYKDFKEDIKEINNEIEKEIRDSTYEEFEDEFDNYD